MSVAGDLIGELDYTTSEAAENKVDKSKNTAYRIKQIPQDLPAKEPMTP